MMARKSNPHNNAWPTASKCKIFRKIGRFTHFDNVSDLSNQLNFFATYNGRQTHGTISQDDFIIDCFERVYDFRLVCPFERPRNLAAVSGRSRKLGNRFFRIFAASSGQPNRLRRYVAGTIENFARGHRPVGVRAFCPVLYERIVQLELRLGRVLYRRRGLFHLSKLNGNAIWVSLGVCLLNSAIPYFSLLHGYATRTMSVRCDRLAFRCDFRQAKPFR